MAQTTAQNLAPIPTSVTQLLGCKYPIIAGPMFLVSDVDLVSEVSKAGGIGATPSLNWRTTDDFRKAVREIKARTNAPFGSVRMRTKSSLDRGLSSTRIGKRP